MKYSIIVPVFNRPDEVDELLSSLLSQTFTDFEVIIVEDGSQKTCEEVCKKYSNQLDLHYFMKSNSGPGQSRNYGAEHAKGEYLLILDSDVVLPEGYLSAIEEELKREPADAFGGPDAAHESFSETQKAISYSMTSFFTTGGIRGGKKKLDKFYPRSFNMGIRRDVYMELGGFSKMRFGEDIDFSIRIFKANKRCRLFPDAWVWLVPSVSYSSKTVGLSFCICAIAPILLYSLLILIDSTVQNKSIKIGFLSIRAAFVQLMGYGFGFIEAWWKRCIKGKDEFAAFEKNFYK